MNARSRGTGSEALRASWCRWTAMMAAKAATKVLFPTVPFIFPAIFVVILGPATFQIMKAMGHVNK